MGLVLTSQRRAPRRGDRQGADRGRPPEVDHRRGQGLRGQEGEPRGEDRAHQQPQDEPEGPRPPDGRDLQGAAGPRLADRAATSRATRSRCRGKTLSPNAVATYLENLKKSPFFAEPVFKNLGPGRRRQGHLQLGDDPDLHPGDGAARAAGRRRGSGAAQPRRAPRRRKAEDVGHGPRTSSSKRSPGSYALGVGLVVGIVARRAPSTTFWFSRMNEEIAAQEGRARGPQAGDPEGPRRRAQAVAVPRRGQAARARARQAPPDPSVQAQHRRADQADRDAHAPGRLHAEEVHAGRVRAEGVLRGVADRHPLDGTYHNLALFFDRMSRFSRIINVEDLKITALERRAGQVDRGPASSPRRSSTRATRSAQRRPAGGAPGHARRPARRQARRRRQGADAQGASRRARGSNEAHALRPRRCWPAPAAIALAQAPAAPAAPGARADDAARPSSRRSRTRPASP